MTMVATMHGWGLAKGRDQAETDVAVLNLMDAVAVPSRHAAAHLTQIKVDAGRIRRVPYGVGQPAGAPDERDQQVLRSMRHAREDGALVVACVGTIGERKNQALLVDSLAWLRRPGSAHVVVVGDGDASGLLESARRQDVLDYVDVRGYSAHARQIASAADPLVLPSRSEGQPIAILEAFADGVPVAVSRVPELTELVEHRVTGLHFDGEDPVALARTLEMFALMSQDDRAAFSARARARYDEEFSLDRMVGNYAEIYAGRS
jgi:glycosyltransferase involved in cell wall biosynthesis